MWYEGGRCLRALNNPNKAIQYYTNAIKYNPNKGLFYAERARTYQLLGQTNAAQSDASIAQKLGENVVF